MLCDYKRMPLRIRGRSAINKLLCAIESDNEALFIDTEVRRPPEEICGIWAEVQTSSDPSLIASGINAISDSIADGLSAESQMIRRLVASQGILGFIRSVVISTQEDFPLLDECARFCWRWTLGPSDAILDLFSDDFLAALLGLFSRFPLDGSEPPCFYRFAVTLYHLVLTCPDLPASVIRRIATWSIHYARLLSGWPLFGNALVRVGLSRSYADRLPSDFCEELASLFLREVSGSSEALGIESLRGLYCLFEQHDWLCRTFATPCLLQNSLPKYFFARDRTPSISVLYAFLMSDDESVRASTFNLVNFEMIQSVFEASDELKQLFCVMMSDIMKRNVEHNYRFVDHEIIDKLCIYARKDECFLVREAAVTAILTCAKYFDFTAKSRILQFGFLRNMMHFFESCDRLPQKALLKGLVVVLEHIRILSDPEKDKYYAQLDEGSGLWELCQMWDEASGGSELLDRVRLAGELVCRVAADGRFE
jgi:hypothetical protein